jgi:uncharacterized integral membrane protein
MGTTDRDLSSVAASAEQPGSEVPPSQPGADVAAARPGESGPGTEPVGDRTAAAGGAMGTATGGVRGTARDAGRRPTERVFVGTGWFWSLIIGIVLALAAVIFVLQNGDPVSVEFLGWEGQVSLAGLVLVVALASIVLDELFGAFYRQRRRRRLTEREAMAAPARRISR